jgi:hypothetical protein
VYANGKTVCFYGLILVKLEVQVSGAIRRDKKSDVRVRDGVKKIARYGLILRWKYGIQLQILVLVLVLELTLTPNSNPNYNYNFTGYNNTFNEEGRFMTWFGGSKMTEGISILPLTLNLPLTLIRPYDKPQP